MTMPKGWPDPDGKRAREREEQARRELRYWHEYNERLYDAVGKRQQSDTKKRRDEDKRTPEEKKRYYDRYNAQELRQFAKMKREMGQIKEAEADEDKAFELEGTTREEVIEQNRRNFERWGVGRARDRENAGLVLVIVGAIVGPFMTLILGVILLNFTLLIIGGIWFIAAWALAGAGQAQTGHYDYYYMWGASRGRTFRMYGAHKATRRR
jgi:hypothetical protein